MAGNGYWITISMEICCEKFRFPFQYVNRFAVFTSTVLHNCRSLTNNSDNNQFEMKSCPQNEDDAHYNFSHWHWNFNGNNFYAKLNCSYLSSGRRIANNEILNNKNEDGTVSDASWECKSPAKQLPMVGKMVQRICKIPTARVKSIWIGYLE